MSKARIVISWILAVLIALAFIASAATKPNRVGDPMFAHWGYPSWFATLIGVLELIGALGLLVPRTTRYAVLWLSVIMFGAA